MEILGSAKCSAPSSTQCTATPGPHYTGSAVTAQVYSVAKITGANNYWSEAVNNRYGSAPAGSRLGGFTHSIQPYNPTTQTHQHNQLHQPTSPTTTSVDAASLSKPTPVVIRCSQSFAGGHFLSTIHCLLISHRMFSRLERAVTTWCSGI